MEKGLILTWLLTYGGAFIALFNPFIGLLAYVSLAILKPETLWYWCSLANAGELQPHSCSALLLGWALQGCGNRRLGRATAIIVAISGYLAWAMVSAVYAEYPEEAWEAVASMAKIVVPLCGRHHASGLGPTHQAAGLGDLVEPGLCSV